MFDVIQSDFARVTKASALEFLTKLPNLYIETQLSNVFYIGRQNK